MYRRVCGITTVMFLVTIFLAGVSWAQQGTTSLRGVITDQQSAAIADGQVALDEKARGIHLERTTDAAGIFEFAQLTPGRYTITVSSAPGFKTASREDLILQVASPATFNAQLALNTVSEAVTVAGSALPVINTSDATLGNAFNSQQMIELPSEGRNPVELLSLQPGFK